MSLDCSANPPLTTTVALRDLSAGTRSAVRGLCGMLVTQRNERIHVRNGSLAIIVAGVLRFTPFRWTALLVILETAQAFEAGNTAIEYAVDIASPDLHPQVRRTIDAAAGAVRIATVIGIGVGLLMFVPQIRERWH